MIWIFLAIVVIAVLWYVSTYNSFVNLKNKVEEAFSTMDVYLKKRYDLIPNLVETVKGYAKHESETLANVIGARNRAASATSVDEKMEAEKQLNASMMNLFAVSEQYPDLKANQNFLSLQHDLKEMEGEITNARKYYNAVVRNFNTKCETIPSNIVANIAHFEKQPLFEVDSAEERKNVKVSF
mgnify:CR=1 FL=1